MDFRKERMGDVLLRTGLVSPEQLDAALEAQEANGGRLGDVLVKLRVTTEEQIAGALAEQRHLPYVHLATATIDLDAATMLPARYLQRKRILPMGFEDGALVLAMADPLDVEAMDETEMLTGLRVTPVIATPSQITEAIETKVIGLRVLHQLEADFGMPEEEEHFGDVTSAISDVPVVKIIDQLLKDAVREGASDVHLEPSDSDVRVRFRVDGVLREVSTLPRGSHAGLVSRIKVLADMDIAERRRPQDGRIAFNSTLGAVDLRVATIPTPSGEGVVIRILYRGIVVGSIEGLGFSKRDHEVFQRMLAKPYGALLIAGPTGSGKTTTLYTALNVINDVTRKVVTIEDPIEYRIPGITQIAVNPRAGLSFATGLRAVLRFDPDIVMVGEVRDAETASIAARAALTGHYVLSSIHTNDAAAALARLGEMGVEPYVSSSSLLGVVAQRLVRTLCPKCKKEVAIPVETLVAAGFAPEEAACVTTFAAVGCSSCHGTGYAGRVGVFEILEMNDEIAGLNMRGANTEEIRNAAMARGMTTMRQDALARVAAGLTSLQEVNRVVV